MKGNSPGRRVSLSPLEFRNPVSTRVQGPGFPPQCTAYLCPVGSKCRGSPNVDVDAPVPEPLPRAGPCLEHPSWLSCAWTPCAQQFLYYSDQASTWLWGSLGLPACSHISLLCLLYGNTLNLLTSCLCSIESPERTNVGKWHGQG